MAILMILELDGVKPDDYEAVMDAMGVDEDNLPQGLVSHAAGPTDDGGFLVVDVWESAEALDSFFTEHAGPAMAQAGIESSAQPQVHQVHNHIPKGSGIHANAIVLIEAEGFGPDDYDAVTGEMDAHAGDGAGHPAVMHVAALKDDGSMVFVDIWESPEAAGRFVEEQVGTAAGSAGVDMGSMEPRVVPVHNHLAAKS
jgi:quinol monooxygenase YgiN